MNFDFTLDQEQFRDQIRRFLEKTDGVGEARKVLDGAASYSTAIWRGLAELGVQAIAIPEEYGGLGLGMLELCVAAEEVGRSLAPIPYLSSVCMCSEAIRLYGSPEQKARWLPGLADGSLIGTWGTADGDGREGAPVTRWADGQLTGSKAPVLDGMIADLMISTAIDEQGAWVMLLCDLTKPGVNRQPVATLDPSRPAARIAFDYAQTELLPGGDLQAWDGLMDHAAVLLAFEQLGGAEAAAAMARGYARDRIAFNRKIASFQAVKHKLVDMYTRIEVARSHCYYGAWAISTDATQTSLASAGARCSAIEAFDFAAHESVQVHGGIGITWESNCQLFYRRARLTALILGSRYEWQNRLVTALERQHPAA